MKLRPIAGLVMAGSALAIVMAPVAQAAQPTVQPVSQHIKQAPMKCTSTNAGSECVSPGNAQINDAPPFVDNYPMYGFMPWIL